MKAAVNSCNHAQRHGAWAHATKSSNPFESGHVVVTRTTTPLRLILKSLNPFEAGHVVVTRRRDGRRRLQLRLNPFEAGHVVVTLRQYRRVGAGPVSIPLKQGMSL